MDSLEKITKYTEKINPRLLSVLIKIIRMVPFINKKINKEVGKEYDAILGSLEKSLKPYRDSFETRSCIPPEGKSRDEVLKEMIEIGRIEEPRWREGYASGAVYHGNQDHIEFLNKIYAVNSQSNPLHSDIWPSSGKYEAEVVSMTAKMLGADKTDSRAGDEVCGVITSGGTESILLAMKTYRDFARAKRGIKRPEMLIPVSAHAAFDKAAQYFNIRTRRIPLDSNFRADAVAARRLINRNTIVIVGSSPSFPHGAIDPIGELSELARSRGIGFHTDACLGGFLLPWGKKLGYDVPPFDFSLPGVTSISVDTHKYGYAAKGTSVILYRNKDLRHYQYFKTADWPGGLYFSPTFAGSRPGALSAVCWAALISIGEKGYMEAAGKILKTAAEIKHGIGNIRELFILGDPLWVIAFGSKNLDIYKVMDYMSKKGWSLNGLHKPSCVHLCVTLPHTADGVAGRFLEDLNGAVKHVKENPGEKGSMAPVYGMAATLPDRTIVADLLEGYMDIIYKV